jgi:hypothetical protein
MIGYICSPGPLHEFCGFDEIASVKETSFTRRNQFFKFRHVLGMDLAPLLVRSFALEPIQPLRLSAKSDQKSDPPERSKGANSRHVIKEKDL